MKTTCPNCQHHFDAKTYADEEAFLVIEKGSAAWKLLESYRVDVNKPKLDDELYEIAQEVFPELDVASPWRLITSLIKSGYVKEVGKQTSKRGRPARVCVITEFGRKTLVGLA